MAGPLQYDAASDLATAYQKASSPDGAIGDVAGRANVFIFPDLNTGEE